MRLLKGVESGPVSRRRVLILAAALVGFLAGGEQVQQIVKRLAELGYVEGRNLRVESTAAANTRALPEAAGQLLHREPHVLVAEGPAVTALAAFTQTIPIVSAG